MAPIEIKFRAPGDESLDGQKSMVTPGESKEFRLDQPTTRGINVSCGISRDPREGEWGVVRVWTEQPKITFPGAVDGRQVLQPLSGEVHLNQRVKEATVDLGHGVKAVAKLVT